MKQRIDFEIIHGKDGAPAFAVIPYEQFLLLNIGDDDPGVPHGVISILIDKECSITRAWREYLGLTQQEVADQMNIKQPTYQKIENSENMEMKTRKRVAKALGIHVSQLEYYDYDDE